ncbi:hypothetical protein Q4610_20965 [Sphingobium sp. HBC34]|uniref:Uncharacterized protein n=1 Tax=Sphingobium cyanobacteriorum TaxID=3063954 RepID=A0ABT8ZSK3_9SPHN|nr:hypothetical protein [Sphingobium sp. HBC34]MDO7837515.1 hypothetical protein [Sphingobium sp. HBC34]
MQLAGAGDDQSAWEMLQEKTADIVVTARERGQGLGDKIDRFFDTNIFGHNPHNRSRKSDDIVMTFSQAGSSRARAEMANAQLGITLWNDFKSGWNTPVPGTRRYIPSEMELARPEYAMPNEMGYLSNEPMTRGEVALGLAEVGSVLIPALKGARVLGVAERGAIVGTEAFGPASFTTKSGEAYFWSGLGRGGAETAAGVARNGGGTTLEMFIESRGIQMPVWDAANPSSVKAWQDVSRVYASSASGEVRAVLGSNLRPGNIWETIELPALRANPNVSRVVTVNPATRAEATLWGR